MKVKVGHVKDYCKESKKVDDDVYIYCGRPSRYQNKFYMKDESIRERVIEQYSNDSESMKRVDYLIDWCLEKQHEVNTLVLICYCHPKHCHCHVIKSKIEVALLKQCR